VLREQVLGGGGPGAGAEFGDAAVVGVQDPGALEVDEDGAVVRRAARLEDADDGEGEVAVLVGRAVAGGAVGEVERLPDRRARRGRGDGAEDDLERGGEGRAALEDPGLALA